MDGYDLPSKIHLNNNAQARNYQRSRKDIVMAVLAIPVVDVELVSVEVANKGNARVNVTGVYLRFLAPHQRSKMVSSELYSPHLIKAKEIYS